MKVYTRNRGFKGGGEHKFLFDMRGTQIFCAKKYKIPQSNPPPTHQGWHSCASACHRPFIFSLDAQVST